jgi:hypothetical protein
MAAMLDVDIDLATRATTNLSKDLAAFANSSVRTALHCTACSHTHTHARCRLDR